MGHVPGLQYYRVLPSGHRGPAGGGGGRILYLTEVRTLLVHLLIRHGAGWTVAVAGEVTAQSGGWCGAAWAAVTTCYCLTQSHSLPPPQPQSNLSKFSSTNIS